MDCGLSSQTPWFHGFTVLHPSFSTNQPSRHVTAIIPSRPTLLPSHPDPHRYSPIPTHIVTIPSRPTSPAPLPGSAGRRTDRTGPAERQRHRRRLGRRGHATEQRMGQRRRCGRAGRCLRRSWRRAGLGAGGGRRSWWRRPGARPGSGPGSRGGGRRPANGSWRQGRRVRRLGRRRRCGGQWAQRDAGRAARRHVRAEATAPGRGAWAACCGLLRGSLMCAPRGLPRSTCCA